jgi:hypothetical protein
MAYIGKSPTGAGIRQRYYFTATGGETSLSGTDDNGLTMSYADGAYVDVNLNGIKLVSGTDYTTTTANTIGGLAALSANDIVEVVAYDIFTVADTVSAKNGGTFNGNVTTTGNISAVDGSFSGDTAITGDLTVDTDTLHVDSTNNRVGIGTTTPDSPLEVSVAGQANMKLTNSSASSELRFIADSSVCYIQTQTNHPIAFATNNGSEAMRISGSDILIGTTNIGVGNIGWSFRRNNASYVTTDGNPSLVVKRGSNTGTAIEFVGPNSNSVLGNISVSTTAVAFNQTSDYRLKENVTDITGATDRLKQLNPVRFNFIADSDTTVDGFLAHEVQAVVPEAVTGTHNEVDDDGNAVMQGIDQSKLVPLLVATIQEQQAAIEALTARVTALEAN